MSTMRIPVVFDPATRLIVEDPTGSNSPFEALSDIVIPAGSFVNVYDDSGTRKIRLADASVSPARPASGFVLENTVPTVPVVVFTSGINKMVDLQQGNGNGAAYTFVPSDIGSSVYLDNTVSGKITKIQPSTPNFQRIGEVIGVNATTVEVAFKPSINVAQDTLSFKGTWDASTNTPALSNPAPTGSRGWYYVVSVAGSSSIGGINTWNAGDWILSDGTTWGRVQNSIQLQVTPNPGGVTPLALGIANIGTSPDAARADHVHPQITELIVQGLILSNPGDAVPLADGTPAVGTATRAAREDHIHPKNTVKTPIRYFFETPLATTDQQPALRIDGSSKIQNIRYYSKTPGNGTIIVYKNGSAITTLSFSSADGTTFLTQAGFTATSLVAGDVITIAVTGSGSAAGVTVQLDIEQYV